MREKINLWLSFFTLHHGLGAGVIPWLVSILITGAYRPPRQALLACLITAMQTMAGFIINRYFDREGDLVRYETQVKPHQDETKRGYRFFGSMKGAVLLPPYRYIHPYTAVVLPLAMFGASVWLAQELPPGAQAIAWVNAILLIPYSIIKRHLGLTGNLIVAYLNASTILFAALALGHSRTVLWPLMISFFAVTLAREIVKDIEDIEADRVNQRRTRVITRLEKYGRDKAIYRLKYYYIVPLLVVGAVTNMLSLLWFYRTAYWLITAMVCMLLFRATLTIIGLRQIDTGSYVPESVLKAKRLLYSAFLVSLGGFLLGNLYLI